MQVAEVLVMVVEFVFLKMEVEEGAVTGATKVME